MALYYFHVRTELGLVEDEDGVDLPDLAAVMHEALASAHEFLAEVDGPGFLAFEVADEGGCVVLRVPIQSLALALQCLEGLSRDREGISLH